MRCSLRAADRVVGAELLVVGQLPVTIAESESIYNPLHAWANGLVLVIGFHI